MVNRKLLLSVLFVTGFALSAIFLFWVFSADSSITGNPVSQIPEDCVTYNPNSCSSITCVAPHGGDIGLIPDQNMTNVPSCDVVLYPILLTTTVTAQTSTQECTTEPNHIFTTTSDNQTFTYGQWNISICAGTK